MTADLKQLYIEQAISVLAHMVDVSVPYVVAVE